MSGDLAGSICFAIAVVLLISIKARKERYPIGRQSRFWF